MTMTSTGLPDFSDFLTSAPLHIPNGKGGAYKTELVLIRTPEKTIKINWWHGDDPRSEPHNHPWMFTSKILVGGYAERRYWFDDRTGNKIYNCEYVYRAGDLNILHPNTYHTVIEILPGTITEMTCHSVTNPNWGYLDLKTSEIISNKDPRFESQKFISDLKIINPHLNK